MAQTWDIELLRATGGGPGGLPIPPGAWRFIACELDGTRIGELVNAYDRKVRHAFNGRLKTASFRLRLDNPLTDFVLAGEVLLKAYLYDELKFTGTLQTFEETAKGDGGSVAFTFADAWARLALRLLGKTATGYADGTALSTVDKTTLVENLLAAANTAGYTGIELGTTAATGATSYVALQPYAKASDAISGIVNTLDGPDVEVLPIEPATVSGGLQIAELTIKPSIGEFQPAAVFEYGTGRRNVASYSRKGDLTLLLNRAYNLPGSADDTGTTVTADDSSSIATFGLAEGLVSADVGVTAFRQELVDEHVRIRRNPRVLITFEPTRNDPERPGRVPQYGVDFGLGDTLPFRAVSEAGAVRVNAALRVYAVDWNITDEGDSLPSFTLTAD